MIVATTNQILLSNIGEILNLYLKSVTFCEWDDENIYESVLDSLIQFSHDNIISSGHKAVRKCKSFGSKCIDCREDSISCEELSTSIVISLEHFLYMLELYCFE